MAAGLLAALFAMGVFSASGIGAQGAPTATATASDMNRDANAATTDIDTLTISLKGLAGVSSGNNQIVIEMQDRLGSGTITAAWGGTVQFADDLNVSGYNMTSGAYTLTFQGAGSIAPGAATITIDLGADNNIDSNTMITAMTLGRGASTDSTQNTVANVPLPIGGDDVPAGPTIKLSPMSVPVNTATDTMVDVTGSHVMGTGDVTISGSGITGATVTADKITATGGFTAMVTIPAAAQTTAGPITITATRAGSLGATANFTVNNLPAFTEAYGALFFGSKDDKTRQIVVEATDADGHPLKFKAESSDADVATVTAKPDATTTDMDANIAVKPVMPGTATITVTVMDSVGGSATTAFNVTVLGVVLSSYNADAPVTVNVIARAENEISGGRDIVIGMPGFGIPDGGIDEDDVLVDGSAANSYYGNPADVSVSGSSITVTIPTKVVGQGGESIDTQISPGGYTVFFKAGAGLSNPNSAGEKTVTVKDRDATSHKLPVDIVSHVSVKPGWASRGDEVAVTGKGINAAGTVTVHLYQGKKSGNELKNDDLVNSLVLGTAPMGDGTAVVNIVTTRSDFKAEAKKATADANASGTNLVAMVDASGRVVGTANVGIQPTVKLDVSEVRRSGKMEISVSDWYYGDIYDVTVNGIRVNLPDGNDNDSEADKWKMQSVSGGKKTFDVIVDRTVRLGTMEVAVYGTTKDQQGSADTRDVHKQTVDVGVFDLSVTPSTAVTDQVVRIEGSGFIGRACITSIMVGEQPIREATSGDDVGTDARTCVDTDTNGKLADSFNVPFGLTPGTYRLVVRDVGNRVGEADLVIPKPMATLNPEIGQRGDTVVVVGENFPAEDLVTVRYRGVAVASASTDTVGQFRATFTVPITAPIGAKHEVLVKSENKGDGSEVDGVQRATLTAKAEHEVPDETLELDPAPPSKVAAGGRLTVIGGNLPLFSPVSVKIGGINAAGRVVGEDDASDGTGRYERVILVPQLSPGTHTVELTAHARNEDISVARFVEIADIVTRPTDEVFNDLIAANQLVVVWRYDNATSTWASYDPTAPAELNDLTLVSTNDIVWVEVTENVMFQGGQLYAGWNLITLE